MDEIKSEQEKPTPFLKRVNELEKKNKELEEQIAQLSQKIEIVIKSLRR
jgi:prefoldin subunit 5